MFGLFIFLFALLILTELVKGLSANGTPPVLQKLPWQMDLAHFMWSNIALFRVGFGLVLIVVALGVPSALHLPLAVTASVFGAIWAGVFWLFNRFWVGRYKFPPLSQKRFVTAADNSLPLTTQVLGVDLNGVQKAFPVNMVFYHHQIPDQVGDKPIWVTYCGLCRSGRVYDLLVDGQALEFTLIGAIGFNAVFQDKQTGSWWRQETGEAAKGPLAGHTLVDVPFAQMSLENWLEAYPDSLVLQEDPGFAQAYGFVGKLLTYEASLPGWHRHETPPMITGVSLKGHARGYDLVQLQKRGVVQDRLAGVELLLVAEADGLSVFVYDRTLDGEVLEFTFEDAVLKDRQTGSTWNQLGRCVDGPLAGKSLAKVQSYQQYVRAWITFHQNTTFYAF